MLLKNTKSLNTCVIKMITSKTFLLIIFNLFSIAIYSQEKKINTLVQYDEFVSNSKSENRNLKSLRIENLINNIQPSIYVESDGLKTYGLKPVSLFTSVKNLSKTKNISSNKENIEIVNIRINTFDDLNSDIDLSKFNGFKKLKYIYIVSDIKCNEYDIKPIIKNIGIYVKFFHN